MRLLQKASESVNALKAKKTELLAEIQTINDALSVAQTALVAQRVETKSIVNTEL